MPDDSDQEIVTAPFCRMRTHENARLCQCLHACCSHDANGECRSCECRAFTEAPTRTPPRPPPPCSECRYGRIRTDCPVCQGTGVMQRRPMAELVLEGSSGRFQPGLALVRKATKTPTVVRFFRGDPCEGHLMSEIAFSEGEFRVAFEGLEEDVHWTTTPPVALRMLINPPSNAGDVVRVVRAGVVTP